MTGREEPAEQLERAIQLILQDLADRGMTLQDLNDKLHVAWIVSGDHDPR